MKNTIYFDAEFAPLLLVNEEQVGSNSIVINIEADSTANQSLLITMDSGTTTSLTVTPGQENSLAIDEEYWSLSGSTFVSLVKGGLTSNSITLIFPETINTDAALEETSNLTYTMTGSNTVTEQIDNLDDRVTALEQGGGGNVVYTSVANPDSTLGNEGDLWVKYFVDYNDILVNSHGDEVKINLPRYESADDAYDYVDLTIRPQIRSMCNLATTAINAFVKAFQGGISIVAYQGPSPTRNITASQFSQLTADTYTTNNQSFSISNGNSFLSWSDNPIHYRYIGISESDLLPFGAIVNMDDFNESLFDGYETTVLYYYVYYNTSNKKFEYIFGSMKFENVNHTYWSDKLSKRTSNITIDLLDTAYYTIDELYCKINDDWTLYDDDDSTTVIVNQVLTSGIEIAQVNGTSIYAPTVSATQTLASGTEIGTVTVGSTSTTLYAPTPQSVSVTQTQTSGTEIGSVTIDNSTTTLYAPTGGGSDVTVTPKASTGTNIADIEVDGTTYQLFAPSGGGGEAIETAFIYSNEERVVGVWTDNKPLYQKNVYIGVLTYDTSWHLLPHNISGLGEVVKVYGRFKYLGDGMWYEFPNTRPNQTTSICVGCNTTNLQYMNNWLPDTQYASVTIQYTKSTDTPGSGPYVTNGSYAHHYSTTEQVIGTWIDGKPIYEITYELATTLTINSTSYIHSGITPANIKSLIGMPEIIDVYGQSAPIMAGIYSSNKEIALAALNTVNGSIDLKYLIVRYTKTTD